LPRSKSHRDRKAVARQSNGRRSHSLESNSQPADRRTFVRQQPIGNYICDFVCCERSLIIEVHGGQHNESAADAIRDRWLTEAGYKVLRFWNDDVLGNIDGVLVTIQAELEASRGELTL
jgi:very-short-patch-repair endonuclease